jgi:peroxiredoxin Q/BCP
MLNINDKIPDFEILTDRGSFTSSNHLGKNIVVFFFPRADTSGCTAESLAFTNLQSSFDSLNCIVIGISKDNPKKQAKFRENIIYHVSLVQTLKTMCVKNLVFG